MPIQFPSFPMLTPADMGRYNLMASIAQGQKPVSNYLDIAKSAAILPYAPLASLAQSASQMAFAKAAMPQAIAKLLAVPGIAANLSTDQIKSLWQMAASGAQSFGSNNIPLPGSPVQNAPAPTQRSNAPSAPSRTQQEIADFVSNQQHNMPKVPQINDLADFVAQQTKNQGVQGVEGSLMSGGGKGVGAGTTYVTPTGEWKSAPTNTVATNLQTSIIGEQRLRPTLERLAAEQAPFTSFGGGFKNLVETGLNYFAPGLAKQLGETNDYFKMEKEFPELSQMFHRKGLGLPRVHAQLTSDLKIAPEALIKIYGLRPTVYALSELRDAVQWKAGETKEDYADRIQNTLHDISANQANVAKQALKENITLDKKLPVAKGWHEPSQRDIDIFRYGRDYVEQREKQQKNAKGVPDRLGIL